MASVKTIKKFSEDSGISKRTLDKWIEEDVLPLVPCNKKGGLRIVDMNEWNRRLDNCQVIIPVG